jgi:hypothetical protein
MRRAEIVVLFDFGHNPTIATWRVEFQHAIELRPTCGQI